MNLNDAIDIRCRGGLAATLGGPRLAVTSSNGGIYAWNGSAFDRYGYDQRIEQIGSQYGGVQNSWAILNSDGDGNSILIEVSTTGGDSPWLVQWPSVSVNEFHYPAVVNIETATFSMFNCVPVFDSIKFDSPRFSRTISDSKTIIKNGAGGLRLQSSYANPVVVNSGSLFIFGGWSGSSASVNGSALLQINVVASTSGEVNVNDSATFTIGSGTSRSVINLAANAALSIYGGGGVTFGGITGSGFISGILGLNLIQDCLFTGRINGRFILTNTDSSNTNNSPRILTLTNSLNSSSGTTTWGIGGDAANATNRGNVVLKLGASGVIPDLVALSIRGSSAATGNGSYQNIFDMNGFNEMIHSLANGGVTSGTNRGLVINNGATDSLLTVLIDTSSATFSGDIKDGATNKISLTKNGSGTQVLSGVNTYSGDTRINAGILQSANASALGSGGNITFGGGTLQYATGINTDISSRIKNSSSVILVNQGSNNVTFASSIDSSNSGGLLKIGTGSLTLSGSNAFTGGVTISSNNSGTLIINNNTALGTGTLTLAHSSAIINSTVSGISIANAVSVTANFTFTGTNNLTLTGNVVLTGTRQVAVSAGVLTMSGVISGSNITKTGAGTLTFSGSSVNTYTGATGISAGTLITTKCTGATASKLTQAVFTPTALAVTFGTAPLANETYRFFPGTTAQSYASAAITLVGAPGRTATYTSSTSTLRIV